MTICNCTTGCKHKKIPNTVKLLAEIHSLMAVGAHMLVLACRATHHNSDNNCIVQIITGSLLEEEFILSFLSLTTNYLAKDGRNIKII